MMSTRKLPILQPMRDPNRCDHCRLQHWHCICEHVPQIEVETRIVVVMHYSESWRTSSTANIAHLALVNSCIHVRGRPTDPHIELSDLVDVSERLPLLLFPSEDAVELAPNLFPDDPRPRTLIVPDGSWRKARRIPKRVPGLADIQHVILPPGPPSRYRMRKQSQPGRVCTYEAIARSLGLLEGPHVQEQLEPLFDLFVERLMYEHR